MSKRTNYIDFLAFRPRIRLTAVCNRKCCYCFAKDHLFERSNQDEIDLKSMEKILSMCEAEKIECIGWQGGEPTLHSKIHEIIKLHKKYKIKAVVFTNGLVTKDTIIDLSEIVDSVLVNCNEPQTYSDDELMQLFENIQLMQETYGKEKVAIGINIYSDKMDTTFIVDYALRTKINEVRIDITRPAPSNGNVFVDFNDINKTFNLAKETHRMLLDNNVKYVHFDCPFPFCAISNENVRYVSNYISGELGQGQCSTALDITQNAQIASCFCSVMFENISYDAFDSLTHAWLFVKYIEDELKWNVYTKDACKECENNKRRLCQGGCLGYKPIANRLINSVSLSSYNVCYDISREISQLYIFYKNGNFDKCYEKSLELLSKDKYKNSMAIKEIMLLSSIGIRQERRLIDEIETLVATSYYPAIEALIFASVLEENKELDYAIHIAEVGVECEKNINKYRLHYFLYKAYKKKKMNNVSNLHLINYYKLSPDYTKKRK